MLKNNSILLSALIISSYLSSPFRGIAQIIPDRTLPLNSDVTNSGNNFVINGGTERGGNLFHSFTELNVPKFSNARFNNSPSIENIISRVTGGNVSNIEGVLSANGTTNLFLLNPSGLLFGPNSRLNIAGSFFATTANQIGFSDGSIFGLDGIKKTTTLSSTFPTRLIFLSDPGSITIKGNGGRLAFFNPSAALGSPLIDTSNGPTGLQTNQGQGIYIFGGPINIDGGVLTAPSGTINLSSIKSGEVEVTQDLLGYGFIYNKVSEFQDIQLDRNSLINASGFSNGKIDVFTNNLSINNSSKLLISSFADTRSSGIDITATGDIFIRGVIDLRFLPSSFITPEPIQGGILTQNFSTSPGPNIQIRSKNIVVEKFGFISSTVFGRGPGGNVDVIIDDSLLIDGTPIVPSTFTPSTISTNTAGGRAGDISLSGRRLTLVNGGIVISQTAGPQAGGNIKANFSESIDLSGFLVADILTNSLTQSSIAAITTGDGDAGNISLFSKFLRIENGANINALTTAGGDGGKINIQATDSIDISGKVPNSSGDLTTNFSGIFSSGSNTNLLLAELFNLTPPSGDAGSITIITNELLLDDNAQIGVLNQGSGNAGIINVNASKISLLDGASITAETFSGRGGEIDIQAGLLTLRNGNITASARQDGPGGNITINSDLIVALDKSRFSANAVNAQGGNIRINTTGFILSPDSQVTATSQRGEQFDGNVEVIAEITDFSQDPNLNIQTDPPDLYSACSPTYRNTLAYYRMGNGGQPISPDDKSSTSQGWLEAANARYAQRHLFYIDTETGEKKPLKRVVGWKSHGDGTITFVSDPKEADQYPAAIAAAKNTCSTEQAKNG